MNDIPSAGDLGYDARRERILIPQTEGDRLVFVDLKPWLSGREVHRPITS